LRDSVVIFLALLTHDIECKGDTRSGQE
jgi:hypothetical protein